MIPTSTITPYALQNSIAAALQTSTALSTFCTGTLGTALTVYSGFDKKTPPPVTKLPWVAVALDNIDVDESYNALIYSYFIGASCQIANTQNTTAGYVAMAGVGNAYTFGTMLQQIVADALTANSGGWDLMRISSVEFDIDFPFVNIFFGVSAVVKES